MDDRLRKFAAIVDSGGFTKAAHDNHISQPALSAAVRKLEHELHTTLLTRRGKVIELTEAGRFAYATAKELDVQTGNLIKKITELEQNEPVIALGMIDSVANAVFASPIAFGMLEHIARLSVVVNNSRYLIRAIERDELDMAFTTHQQSGRLPSSLESMRLASEAMPLVCHPDDEPYISSQIHRGRLPNFISYDHASTTYNIVTSSLHEIGLEPDILYYSSSPEVILRLVQLQKGTAVLPYISVKELMARGQLVGIGITEPIVVKRDIGLIHRRDKPLTPTLSQIALHIQDLFGADY